MPEVVKKSWPSWLFTWRVTSRYMRLKHASPSAAGSAAAIASMRAIAPATRDHRRVRSRQSGRHSRRYTITKLATHRHCHPGHRQAGRMHEERQNSVFST